MEHLTGDCEHEEKTCKDCGRTQPLSNFTLRSDTKKYQNSCKECKCKYIKAYREANPERFKAQRKVVRERAKLRGYKPPDRRVAYSDGARLALYNLTREEYYAILERQNNVCAICGKPETTKNRNDRIRALAIDHDHVTGEVRGLLCFKCNTNLGWIENKLTNIKAYLNQEFL